MSATTSSYAAAEARDPATRLWWIYLFTGGAWLLFALIVFRFDYTSVSSISILFGIVMIAAGITELVGVFLTEGWWRLVAALLALAFIVIGIVAFVHPGNTFAALAAVMSFYFVFKGAFDVTRSIWFRHELDVWWLILLIGIAELLLGFWAAGDFGNSAFLLVVWVGAVALTRGISEIFAAFALRSARSA